MTIKAIKRLIESHQAFNDYYEMTGEDYDYSLELWIEKYYDLVGVTSQDEQDQLIINLNQ